MAYSKVVITIVGDPTPYHYISLSARHKDTPPNGFGQGTAILYEQWVSNYPFDGNRINNTTLIVSGTPSQSLYNLYQAIKLDWRTTTKDYDFVLDYAANTMTITAKESCIVFATNYLPNPEVTIDIINEVCNEDPAIINETLFGIHPTVPCSKVLITLTTDVMLSEFDSDITVVDNPYIFNQDRGTTITHTGKDINGTSVEYVITTPGLLLNSDFALQIENRTLDAKITVIHNSDLGVQFKIDSGDWQTSNIFYIPLGATYTLYIQDQYGCEISEVFIVNDFVLNVPTTIQKKYCGSLHELNKGKYLNLFGKQHTMKLGFVCNAKPQTIKIFKHIQMVLNTEYSVKNVNVKTASKQERFIPGDHMVYRIREGMHSVPLKNPSDWDDLRAGWSYIELEIESINNTKVDLFSVIMHLRKSSI